MLGFELFEGCFVVCWGVVFVVVDFVFGICY